MKVHKQYENGRLTVQGSSKTAGERWEMDWQFKEGSSMTGGC